MNLILATIISLSANAAELPFTFFAMPENQLTQNQDLLGKKEPVGIEEFINAQAEALDKVTPQKADNGWHLSSVAMTTGLTQTGVFGILPFKGRVANTLFWRPKGMNSAKAKSAASKNAGFEVSLNRLGAGSNLKAVISDTIQLILATVKVPDKVKFERDFLDVTSDFIALAQYLNEHPHKNWKVDKITLKRGVTATGRILAVGQVGGAIEVKWSWNIKDLQGAPTPPNKLSKELEELFTFVADEMDRAVESSRIAKNWELTQFKFGLGINPGLPAGIARAELDAMGEISMSRTAAISSNAPVSVASGVWLIDSAAKAEHVNYAKAQKIEMLKGGNSDGNIVKRIAYKLNRGKFTTGLRYALENTQKVLTRLETPDRSWEVFEVHSNYDLSVSGGVYLTLLEGYSSTHMTFVRK